MTDAAVPDDLPYEEARDQLIEQAERNIEPPDRIAYGYKYRVCAWSAFACRAPSIQPRVQLLSPLLARDALVVRQVVCLAHKRVDGADGIAAFRRQRNEGVVEILGFAPGDFAAHRVCAV